MVVNVVAIGVMPGLYDGLSSPSSREVLRWQDKFLRIHAEKAVDVASRALK